MQERKWRNQRVQKKKWNNFMKQKKTEKTTIAEGLVLGNCVIATFSPG